MEIYLYVYVQYWYIYHRLIASRFIKIFII